MFIVIDRKFVKTTSALPADGRRHIFENDMHEARPFPPRVHLVQESDLQPGILSCLAARVCEPECLHHARHAGRALVRQVQRAAAPFVCAVSRVGANVGGAAGGGHDRERTRRRVEAADVNAWCVPGRLRPKTNSVGYTNSIWSTFDCGQGTADCGLT